MAVIDVIKYEGKNEILVWKHPREDFNTAVQLIVHETQEAVVFKDGQASDVYLPGKYTIETDNIPGIKSFAELMTGGVSPNHCEVYFVNKVFSMNVLWGTSAPMIIQDPLLQLPIKIRAHGQFVISVNDTKKLLLKLIGTTQIFTQRTLSEYFRGLLINRIKDNIANQMIQQEKSFLEINSYLTDISKNIKDKIADAFVEYGLVMEEFYVEAINIEEDEGYKQVRDAMIKRATQRVVGYDYVTERSFDVAEKQAGNQGTSGAIAGMGIGMGVGASAGVAMGGMMNRALQPVVSAANSVPVSSGSKADSEFGILKPKKKEIICAACGNAMSENDKFCSKCGNATGAELLCKICGGKVKAGDVFCASCGSRVGE